MDDYNYPEVVNHGVEYVNDYVKIHIPDAQPDAQPPNQSPKPIQILFLFSGKGVLECRIIRMLKIKGYNIERCWFVDEVYKEGGIGSTITNILNDKNPKMIDGGFIRQQHKRVVEGTTKITNEKLKNNIMKNEYVISPSFENLQMVMENYVDATRNFVVITINPQVLHVDDLSINPTQDRIQFGTFMKMFVAKFNVQNIGVLWRTLPQYIVVPTSKIVEKDALANAKEFLKLSKKIGGCKKPATTKPKPKSRPAPPKKVKKDAVGRPK